MKLQECINFALTSAQKRVNQYFSEKIMDYDITPSQYAVLRCLWDNDFQTPGQIAQALSLDSSSITGLLDRMENKELLTRISSSADRRALQVVLMPKGKELEEPISRLVEEANNETLAPFTKEERAFLMKALNILKEPAEIK